MSEPLTWEVYDHFSEAKEAIITRGGKGGAAKDKAAPGRAAQEEAASRKAVRGAAAPEEIPAHPPSQREYQVEEGEGTCLPLNLDHPPGSNSPQEIPAQGRREKGGTSHHPGGQLA